MRSDRKGASTEKLKRIRVSLVNTNQHFVIRVCTPVYTAISLVCACLAVPPDVSRSHRDEFSASCSRHTCDLGPDSSIKGKSTNELLVRV